MTTTDEGDRRVLLRRGFALEWVTLGWNVAGIIVLAVAVTLNTAGPLGGCAASSPVVADAGLVVGVFGATVTMLRRVRGRVGAARWGVVTERAVR